MQNISTFIEEFQTELNRQCFAFDGTWVKRKRKLNSKTMVNSIVFMMAQRCCNFKDLSSLISIADIDSPVSFSASSFCDARKKFPPYIFIDLSQWIYNFVNEKFSKNKWFGRSVFAIDSTRLNVPRELISEGFGYEGDQGFYPQALCTILYDLRLGLVYDSIISQHRSERINSHHLFKSVPKGDLVIGDRGFFSFELLHEALENEFDVLFRISAAHAPEEIQELAALDIKDEIVTITPSIPTERKLLKHGYSPAPLEVRVLRQKIAGKEYYLVTTILEREVTHKDFFNLYQSRWDIEEYFKLIKSELSIESYKSRNLNGVLQEIFATIFLTTLAEALSRLQIGIKVKKIVRKVVSTLTVVRLVRDCIGSIMNAKKSRILKLSNVLSIGIGKACSNFRGGRSYPRNLWEERTPWTRYAKGIRR